MQDRAREMMLLEQVLNNTARTMPWVGLPAILGKPIAQAGLAGLDWGAGATRAASQGHMVDPSPSMYHMMNLAGLGGPASGLTSQGAKAAPWFSAVGKAIESAPLNSAPGSQWLGTLKNQPGVKPEEMDWTGLTGWLGEQKGPVPKQSVKDYFDKNKVELQEVVKGSTNHEAIAQREFGRPLRELTRQERGTVDGLARYGQNDIGTTKFSQYQLPGGENYREMLLTLPPNKAEDAITVLRRGGFSDEHIARLKAHNDGTFEETVKTYSRSQEGFRSSHYDEPNVLAHVRFNDRTDAQGKKTLFLEEVQSDWHQKGRKQGYQDATALRAFEDYGNKLAAKYDLNPKQNLAMYGTLKKMDPAEVAEYERLQHAAYQGKGDTQVPDAPFKQSRDWGELSLKRMIKKAADEGYDSISWTPGKVQAARYDLSKQVEGMKLHLDGPAAQRGGGMLEIRPKGDDSRNGIRVQFDKDGKVEASHGGHQFEGKTLDEIIGKEMAEKVLNDARAPNANAWGVKNMVSSNWSPRFASKAEAEAYQQNLPEATRAKTVVQEMTPRFSKEYRGLDLQVGGEGMKGFYDQILPNVANKLGKKFGAKVGVTKVGAGRTKSMEADALRMEGYSEAEIAQKISDQEVWTLPITDAMRKEYGEKGAALFAGGKGATLASTLQQALTGKNDGDRSLGEILSEQLNR